MERISSYGVSGSLEEKWGEMESGARKSESCHEAQKCSFTIDFPTRWVSINNKHTQNPSQIQFHTFNYLIFHLHEREGAAVK